MIAIARASEETMTSYGRFPVRSAEEAAGLISHGATLGIGGFTDPGCPKAVPTAEEAARQAVEEHVDIVGASTLAAGHLTLVPALRQALTKLGHENMPIVLGGVIPPQDYDKLYTDGALAIFGPTGYRHPGRFTQGPGDSGAPPHGRE